MPYNDLKKPRLFDELYTIGDLTGVLSATFDVLAIDYVSLEAGSNLLDLGSFETGSQLKIEPIVRTGNNGTNRIVAHKLTGTLISINNNVALMPDIYDQFTNQRVQMDVHLTSSGVASIGRPERVLNFSKSDRELFIGVGEIVSGDVVFDNRVTLTYATEMSDDYRVRLVINVTAWIQNYKYCRYVI